ncbi:hypothetical protein [Aeromonas phage AS-sw]|uniref:Uncharacterized protein n=1 Tax=Aeromonas phage AS-sw TaxID=2026113 RepID=A0A291LGD2_9CAUD|nr:hypothetical protein HWB29_gp367 [Aeromonas phage AS-sw]ATI18417.1 hypothetical protein [Aeromonas phage AS-sw]
MKINVNTVTLIVSLNKKNGDVENWIFPTHYDKSSIYSSISYMENKYDKPVEVYHFQNCYPDGLMSSWDGCTPEQKTGWIKGNLKNMVYSTKKGFTKYGKSIIVEPVYDEE